MLFLWDASFYSVSQFLNSFSDLPSFPSSVFQLTVKTLLHFRWQHSGGFEQLITLEIILLQVTSYRAHLMQISP